MLQSFTVKKSDGTTDVVMSLQTTLANEASYVDKSLNLSAPRIMRVSHNLKAVGGKGSDRHNVLSQLIVVDANGIPFTISAGLTWTIPRSAAVTDTLAKDVLAGLLNYLALPGVKDDMLDGVIS